MSSFCTFSRALRGQSPPSFILVGGRGRDKAVGIQIKRIGPRIIEVRAIPCLPLALLQPPLRRVVSAFAAVVPFPDPPLAATALCNAHRAWRRLLIVLLKTGRWNRGGAPCGRPDWQGCVPLTTHVWRVFGLDPHPLAQIIWSVRACVRACVCVYKQGALVACGCQAPLPPLSLYPTLSPAPSQLLESQLQLFVEPGFTRLLPRRRRRCRRVAPSYPAGLSLAACTRTQSHCPSLSPVALLTQTLPSAGTFECPC
jgi:hypothetical protein